LRTARLPSRPRSSGASVAGSDPATELQQTSRASAVGYAARARA
jgi:hypothetical protein